MLWPAVISIATFFANIGFNLLFISLYGFNGAPLATSMSRALQLVLTVAVSLYVRHQQIDDDKARAHSIHNGALEWPEIRKCLFVGCTPSMLWSYMKLGLPGERRIRFHRDIG